MDSVTLEIIKETIQERLADEVRIAVIDKKIKRLQVEMDKLEEERSKIPTIDKDELAFNMKQDGHSLAEIADVLGVSRERVKQRCKHYQWKSEKILKANEMPMDSIYALGLSTRVAGILRRRGIETVGQLMNRLHLLHHTYNFGDKAFSEIIYTLYKAGYLKFNMPDTGNGHL